MKRVLTLLTALILSVAMLSAKDRKTEDCYYGPRKGDFALSFGMRPVLNFVGNMFNGTSGQSFPGLSGLSNDFYSGASISGKYMLSNKVSLNASIGIDCLGKKQYTYGGEKNTVSTKETVKGTNEFMFLLGPQFYMRTGRRVQPVIGLDLMYAFANDGYIKEDDIENDKQSLTKTPSNTFGFLADFGVECFVSKMVSIKLGVDLGVARTINKSVKEADSDNDYSRVSSSQTRFATGMTGADIALNFYF
ncbi:MAG: hypothetical protein ACI3Y8_00765 [Candidatus Cryptobacteroides sp.]